jgi:hypothetical protein
MQGAAREAAPRQVAVDEGKAQGDGLGRTEILLHPGQQTAQFFRDGGAVAHDGKGARLGHGRLYPILEQNTNKAKVPLWTFLHPEMP